MTSREVILSEIKRLAQEIGRSPGKNLFQKETAIPESHWYGKYWLSWKDALEEAGLKPNLVPDKISRDELLEQYAMAVRHFQAIPTVAQLKMYSRQNPTFPSQSTYSKTFRDKAGLLNVFKEWVIQQKKFSDIVELLPEATASVGGLENVKEGNVYLLKSGGFYKIGRSDEVERRVKEVSVALPEKIELVHAIRTDDPPGIETYWHRRFADRRANGEWFKLSPSDIKAFKRRKFQ